MMPASTAADCSLLYADSLSQLFFPKILKQTVLALSLVRELLPPFAHRQRQSQPWTLIASTSFLSPISRLNQAGLESAKAHSDASSSALSHDYLRS